MSVTPIDGGASVKALERAAATAWRRLTAARIAWHEAEIAYLKRTTTRAEEVREVARDRKIAAKRAHTTATERLEEARQVAAAA